MNMHVCLLLYAAYHVHNIYCIKDYKSAIQYPALPGLEADGFDGQLPVPCR